VIRAATRRDVCFALAQLLKGGIGASESVRLAAENTAPAATAQLNAMRARLDRGSTISDAMKVADGLFTPQQVTLVESFEPIGTPAAGFATIAALIDEHIADRRQLILGAAYPTLLLFVNCFVSPIGLLRQSTGAYTSGVFRELATLVIIGALHGLLLPPLFKSARLRRAAWRLPWPATVYVAGVRAIFCRTLGRNLAAGVAAIDALRSAARVAGDPTAIDKLRRAEPLIEKTGLAAQLVATGLVSGTEATMVTAGQHTGTLPDALEKAADRYSEARRRGRAAVLKTIGAIVTAIVALVIARTVITTYQSMFSQL